MTELMVLILVLTHTVALGLGGFAVWLFDFSSYRRTAIYASERWLASVEYRKRVAKENKRLREENEAYRSAIAGATKSRWYR